MFAMSYDNGLIAIALIKAPTRQLSDIATQKPPVRAVTNINSRYAKTLDKVWTSLLYRDKKPTVHVWDQHCLKTLRWQGKITPAYIHGSCHLIPELAAQENKYWSHY